MCSELRDQWLMLSLVQGLGPTLIRRCVQAMGSPAAVLEARVTELGRIEGVGIKLAPRLRVAMDRVADGGALAVEKQLLVEYGATFCTIDEQDYPMLLRHIPDPPPLLYVRGELRPDDAVALAIVGARRCSQYGIQQADRLAALCSGAGLCIVSGGAYGIDVSAHRSALRADGRTIAVLGSGLGEPYPAEHTELFDAITAGHGAVVSELPMAIPAKAENFPRRNRIISGLALGVLVVEASLRSGALITARLCAEDHGREVMALPGRVDAPTSAGCNKMVREGWATLVTGCGDILDALGETGQLLKAGVTASSQAQAQDNLFEQNLTESQQQIVSVLVESHAIDQIAATTGLAVQVIGEDLTLLQIRGVVEKSGLVYQRKR